MKIPVLFPKIFNHPFTYEASANNKLIPGDFVKAPFGAQNITGIVWSKEQKTEKKFRSAWVGKNAIPTHRPGKKNTAPRTL